MGDEPTIKDSSSRLLEEAPGVNLEDGSSTSWRLQFDDFMDFMPQQEELRTHSDYIYTIYILYIYILYIYTIYIYYIYILYIYILIYIYTMYIYDIGVRDEASDLSTCSLLQVPPSTIPNDPLAMRNRCTKNGHSKDAIYNTSLSFNRLKMFRITIYIIYMVYPQL